MIELEQELACIAKFIIAAAGNPTPYYNEVQEGFVRPAVYFPMPEVDTGGDTLKSYAADYAWYIKFFANTREEAYKMAFDALTEISQCRCLIPLYSFEGEKLRKGLRIKFPNARVIDEGAAQLTINFRSYRPYRVIEGEKMMIWTAAIASDGLIRTYTNRYNRGEAD